MRTRQPVGAVFEGDLPVLGFAQETGFGLLEVAKRLDRGALVPPSRHRALAGIDDSFACRELRLVENFGDGRAGRDVGVHRDRYLALKRPVRKRPIGKELRGRNPTIGPTVGVIGFQETLPHRHFLAAADLHRDAHAAARKHLPVDRARRLNGENRLSELSRLMRQLPALLRPFSCEA